MTRHFRLRSHASILTAGFGVAAGAYGAYAAVAWYRYGRISHATGRERDELLDRFLPAYDIVERHHIRVGAPAAVTVRAAREQDLLRLRSFAPPRTAVRSLAACWRQRERLDGASSPKSQTARSS